MRFAHIITNDRIYPKLFVEVSTFNNCKINENEPTLLVGVDLVKKHFPDFKLKFLDRRINDNVYWTFSKFEKRNVYEEDLESFYNMVYNRIQKDIRYFPVSLLSNGYNYYKRFLNYLSNGSPKVVLVLSKEIYIYNNRTILGVSVDELDYVGISKGRVLDKLRTFSNVRIVENLDILNGKDKYLENDYLKYLTFIFSTV